MTESLVSKKQETLGRWATAITALMLLAGGALLFSTNTSLWVVGGLILGGLALLWLALFASPKVAIMLGNLFPLG